MTEISELSGKQQPGPFGRRLRDVMDAKRVNVTELAELAGMQQPAVSRLLTTSQSPRWDTVLKLCAALGVEPNDFREPGADDAPPEPPVGPASKRK